MPSGNEPYEQADIRIGEVIWSKTNQGSEATKQKEHLSKLAEMAQDGVILDCRTDRGRELGTSQFAGACSKL